VTLAVALAAAAGLAGLGLRLRWLSAGGATAATAVGTAVFWGGGLAGAVILAGFFASGSLLTAHTARMTGAGPQPRTAAQVLANGACAAVGALILPHAPEGWLILAGATAAAQADTWATEIGARASAPPRLITTLTPVPQGTSGGVTPLGTAGGVAGATTAAAVAGLVGAPQGVAMAALVAGIVGMTADSLLGATLQARYRCAACGVDLEHRQHVCGLTAAHVRGLRWMSNDAVNLLATIAGAAAAWAWARGPGW